MDNHQANKNQNYASAASKDIDALLKELGTTKDGLTDEEAKERLKQAGFNEIASKKPLPWTVQLLKCFIVPFNILLLAIAILSFETGNPQSTILIVMMVLLSTFLKFFQEYRSGKAAEQLKEMVKITVAVIRQGSQAHEIPMKCVVPGDMIQLGSGDLVPADVRLISAKDLYVQQAALTGESMPAEKQADTLTTPQDSPFTYPNLCFMGTDVVSGKATAVVLKTGNNTYFGSLAKEVVENDPETSFEKGIQKLSWLIIRLILAMVVVIFAINVIGKGNWLEAFLFSLSVAIGLTPEMLPMIVSTNLAKGAILLSHQKVIVKRLDAIQNFGAMDVLCTDKTGTLTQNKVMLYKHLDVFGKKSVPVLQYAYLNSYFQSGLRNLLDDAILVHAHEDEQLHSETDYQLLDEIPFDFQRKRLTVVVNRKDETTNHQALMLCKGAVEEILSVCNTAWIDNQPQPLSDALNQKIQDLVHSFNEDGFRVIAIATKTVDVHQKIFTAQDESALTLQGFICFLDPPKETSAQALAELSKLNIETKILTGDNEIVTKHICKHVGLVVKGILLGHDIDGLDDTELAEKAENTTIFAKLTPTQKARMIRALQQKNHVVGYLGDGINDAPALRMADVGISVNNGADIAKESATIILLEKSLLILKDGVVEGRRVFGNIIKYIRMVTSSNFGNVFSMVGASMMLPFLPMRPIHILIQNLMYDISQTATPLDKVDEEYLLKPRQWDIHNIQRFMLCFGPISSVFDYATFGVMWFIFHADTVAKQSLFQSGWFIEGLLSQTLIIHFIRTRRIPFLESWAAPPLIFMTLLIAVLGIGLPYTPIGHSIGLTDLPGTYFLYLSIILVCYFVLTQIAKMAFIKKFGYN